MGPWGRIREVYDVQQGPLEIFERLLCFIGLREWRVLFGHL